MEMCLLNDAIGNQVFTYYHISNHMRCKTNTKSSTPKRWQVLLARAPVSEYLAKGCFLLVHHAHAEILIQTCGS